MTSFWPSDISQKTVRAPVTILKEQALFLGRQTRNMVEANVAVNSNIRTAETQFVYDFVIYSPALSFSYRLFFVIYGIDLYPVFFKLEADIAKEILLVPRISAPEAEERFQLLYGQGFLATSEEDFIGILKAILNSEKTKNVIRGIMAHVS